MRRENLPIIIRELRRQISYEKAGGTEQKERKRALTRREKGTYYKGKGALLVHLGT